MNIIKKTYALLLYLCLLPNIAYTEESIITLPTIEIENTNEENTEPTGQSLTFEAQDLNEQGANKVSDFLKKQGIASVQANSAQQNQNSLSLRGFGTNADRNSLILIDGLPLKSFSHLPPNIDQVPIENIEYLDIGLGSYGSLYGDQAIGGVLNIITTIPETNKRRLSLGLGNLNQQLVDLFLAQNFNEQLRTSLDLQFYNNNHIQINNQQSNYLLSNQWRYEHERHKLDLMFSLFKTDIQIPQSLFWPNDSTNALPSNNHLDQTSYLNKIGYQWLLNDDWKLHTELLTFIENNNGFMFIPFTSHQRSIIWHNVNSYRDKLIFGFDVLQQIYHLENKIKDDTVSSTNIDLFVRVNQPLTQKLSFAVGGRATLQTLIGQIVNQPKEKQHHLIYANEQSLYYKLSNKLKLYLRRDTNFRLVKASELVWVSSNLKTLKNQTGTAYEVGFDWLDNIKQFSLGLFRLDINNEIDYDPMPAKEAPYGRVYNLPKTQRIGIISNSNIKLTKKLEAQLQGQFVRALIIEKPYQNKSIPNVPPVTASISLNYLVTPLLSVNLNQTYYGRAYPAFDLTNQSQLMPSYSFTNINFIKYWHDFEFMLQINNLFDLRAPRYAVYYPKTNQTKFYPNDGRSVLFKVTLRGNG